MMQTELRASWLADARRDAWAAFQRTEPPVRTVETWRRVDPDAWRLNLLTDANLSTLIGHERGLAEDAVLGEAAGVFHQGGNRLPASVVLDPELARQGVLLMSLEEAAQSRPDLVRPRLQSLQAGSDFRKLETANLAQFRGGAFLYIPPGLKVEKPFDLGFSHYQSHPFVFPRVLVVLGEGSEATVVEEHRAEERRITNESRKLFSAAFSHAVLGRGSRLRFYYSQGLSLDTAHFWHQKAELDQDSLLQHYSIFLGASVHKSELDVRLAGPGARSELYGILLGTKNQVFDPHTIQWHGAPRTTSDLLFRSALRDRAKAIYTGLLRIEKEARGSEAYQQNNNLLLSDTARADSTPVLEILTEDVRCKHGATVGPVSQDELFYLTSRGLPPEEAVRMLVMGFFEPILGRLPLERLRDLIPGRIEARLSPSLRASPQGRLAT